MTGEKLNGSTDLLAKAMRQVFTEAVEGAVEPLREDIKGIREDVNDIRDTMATKDDIKRLETDMENGFAELRPPEEAAPVRRAGT